MLVALCHLLLYADIALSLPMPLETDMPNRDCSDHILNKPYGEISILPAHLYLLALLLLLFNKVANLEQIYKN